MRMPALLGQKCRELPRVHVDEVSEHMDVGAFAHGGHLDAGHEGDALARGRPGRRIRMPATRIVVGDAQHGDAQPPPRARPARPVCSGRPTPSYGCGDRSTGRLRERHAPGRSLPALALAQRAVLANEQIEVGALLVGELEKYLLPFGILEPLAVAFEELVRAALALDADEQRLLVVHAFAKLLGAGGEEPARRAFEEQEGRAPLELRILRHELAIALLQRREVFAFLRREPLEHRPSAGVLRQAAARV